MKQLTSAEVRQLFLDFFKENGHIIEPSSSLVPKDDPTLLWINSGVATMKKYFDGSVVPKSPRITSAQKSLRANDIENVGVTARHHTLFEMLGNFSIGDYFKEEAIEFAWEFLTSDKWLGFDKEKLYVTVYPEDQETYDIWKDKIGVAPDHIVLCDDNYWEIGEGPAGPCTEIFYDRGEAYNYDTPEEELSPIGENDRYIEIWNVVFSQYNAMPGTPRSEYKELPSKNIDTGFGLERAVSIIQDGETNFETDLFLPIIQKISELSGVDYETATAEQQTAFKVIADHSRAATFTIADGALPSNEGRGYVIRRLLRRASRLARQLGFNEPFMYKLVPTIIEIMKPHYGYLVEKRELIEKILLSEEQRFLLTLSDGEKILEQMIEKSKNKMVSGEDGFILYDTYGFPIELTQEILEEKGLTIDVDAFEKQMQKQKEQARDARQVTESMHVQSEIFKAFETPSLFTGYDELVSEAEPLLIVSDEDKKVKALSRGERGYVIFDKTPFYAASGGQVSDSGTIMNDRSVIRVREVQKAPNGQTMHYVDVIEGVLEQDKEYTLKVDASARRATEKNHTATHLLQHALRSVLGNHVEQAGSVVDKNRLRFDFTHYEAVTPEQLAKIEQKVNELIWAMDPVIITEMNIEDAKALGAMALFGEKYGDTVRVVQAGKSIELCGGTHVNNTGEIGILKIESESGIGSGVRRIEALTSKAVYDQFTKLQTLVDDVRKTLKRKTIHDIQDAVASVVSENKTLETRVKKAQKATMANKIQEAIKNPKVFNGKNVIFVELNNYSMNDLKEMVDLVKERKTDYVAVLVSNEDDKTNFVVAASKENSENIKSNEIIKKLNQVIESRGGGKPEIAQASINEILESDRITDVIEKSFEGEK